VANRDLQPSLLSFTSADRAAAIYEVIVATTTSSSLWSPSQTVHFYGTIWVLDSNGNVVPLPVSNTKYPYQSRPDNPLSPNTSHPADGLLTWFDTPGIGPSFEGHVVVHAELYWSFNFFASNGSYVCTSGFTLHLILDIDGTAHWNTM